MDESSNSPAHVSLATAQVCDPAVLAIDVGGANIKGADGLGWVTNQPFELWRHWDHLPTTLAGIAKTCSPRRIVATMTGEIADCYPSRCAGVRHSTASLQAAAQECKPHAELGIYLLDGRIVSPAEAIAKPLAAAASNWHAVARLAAALTATSRAMLIDIGSTTTDIVAICDGIPSPLASDDVGRMATGELVYTGVERTPVAAIVRSLPLAGSRRPIASELYAQSRDVWMLLEGIPPDPQSYDTADGGPATPAAARVRLARMLLANPDSFSVAEAIAAAEWCAKAQCRQVARAMARVARSTGWQPTSVVLSGHGMCLGRRALAALGWPVTIVSLADSLGCNVSRAAPAHALAMIARGILA